jgi:hypothetical protein
LIESSKEFVEKPDEFLGRALRGKDGEANYVGEENAEREKHKRSKLS